MTPKQTRSLPAFKERLLTLTTEPNPDYPDTTLLEENLRIVRNPKFPRAKRQEGANLGGLELAVLFMDEQNVIEYIELLEAIIEHEVDGAGVLQEFYAACDYVWPSESKKDIGAVFRFRLRKRWDLKKKKARRVKAEQDGMPLF